MMNFLMIITLDVKLDVDVVTLVKLRSTLENVFLVGVLHSLFMTGSVSESTISFSILFWLSLDDDYPDGGGGCVQRH